MRSIFSPLKGLTRWLRPVFTSYASASDPSSSRTGCHSIQLVMALVIFRLDYCNSVLAALSAVLSASTTAGTECCSTADVWTAASRPRNAAFVQLDWLPTRWRIHCTLFVLMHAAHSGRCPVYLVDTVFPAVTTPNHERTTIRRFQELWHHVCALSSANVRFPTQDQQPGTHYLLIYSMSNSRDCSFQETSEDSFFLTGF